MNTRTQLLDSAERAARARGFDGFSYADLAAEVGIRKPSIHHHFPTKADLALALISRYRDTFSQSLDNISAKTTTSMSKLKAYVKLYRDALSGGEMVCLCVAFSVGADSFDRPVLDEINGFHDDSIKWVTKLLKEGLADGSINNEVKPAAEAAGILALLEGAQLTARAAGDVGRFDSAARLLAERLKP